MVEKVYSFCNKILVKVIFYLMKIIIYFPKLLLLHIIVFLQLKCSLDYPFVQSHLHLHIASFAALC